MLKTAEKVVDVSVQLKTAKESLTIIQGQLTTCKKTVLKSIVKTGVAASIADCQKVQDLEREYMTCLNQIHSLEQQLSPPSSQLLSTFIIFIVL